MSLLCHIDPVIILLSSAHPLHFNMNDLATKVTNDEYVIKLISADTFRQNITMNQALYCLNELISLPNSQSDGLEIHSEKD